MYEGGGSDGDRCATEAKGTPNTGPAPTHHHCAREPRPPRRTPRRPPIYIYTSSGERGSVCRREDPTALSAAAAAAAAAARRRGRQTTRYHSISHQRVENNSSDVKQHIHMQDNNIGGRRLCGRISRLVCARLCRPHAAFSATLRASIAAPGPGPGLSLSRTRAPFRRSR